MMETPKVYEFDMELAHAQFLVQKDPEIISEQQVLQCEKFEDHVRRLVNLNHPDHKELVWEVADEPLVDMVVPATGETRPLALLRLTVQ